MLIPDRFHDVEGWPEQLRRVERWRDRVLAIVRTRNGVLDDDAFDFVYAFFQAAHHLRDWLLESGAATVDELNALRDSSPSLQLCEDLCNSSKHYRRSGKVRVSATLGFQRQYVPASGLYGERWAVVTPTSGFERVDLADLVSECFGAWAEFCRPRLASSAAPPDRRSGSTPRAAT